MGGLLKDLTCNSLGSVLLYYNDKHEDPDYALISEVVLARIKKY